MPTCKESRCEVSIPFGATGEDAELCGGLAYQVCENCGVICESCAESFPCPLVSDGKHVFVTPGELAPTPEPTFDTYVYLRAWDGIGANHKNFDDYHEFFLRSVPCFVQEPDLPNTGIMQWVGWPKSIGGAM